MTWKFCDNERALLRALSHVAAGPFGCWIWTASRDVRGGYAQMNLGSNRVVRVHRWLYQQMHGPVDKTLDLDHLCKVRECVNPVHLEPVTRAENLRRGLGSRRRLFCLLGHTILGENVYTRPGNGRRECLICKKASRTK